MISKQRAYGQYETPPDVADLLLAFSLRRASDHILDPSCGEGAFLARAYQYQQWLAPDAGHLRTGKLWGVELDAATAAQAQVAVPQAHILCQNFFDLQPDPDFLFDAIIGNPPYTRAMWISRLEEAVRQAQQLAFLPTADSPAAPAEETLPAGQPIPRAIGKYLSHRSSLYAYFFLHGAQFLREGGRFGFVVPNSWLDVAYGALLKQFLLEHYKIVTIIESAVERWFEAAKINTCLVVLERCRQAEARAGNRVRLVRLRRPLASLIGAPADDGGRLSHLERLTMRLLPGDDVERDDLTARVVGQRELAAAERWGAMMRAPRFFWQRQRQPDLIPLKEWATVQRGLTTGANAFFYLDDAALARWQIEPEFCRPLLKSLRQADNLILSEKACRYQALMIPANARLEGAAVADYIAWGESQAFHRRATCAARRPWYSLPPPPSFPLLLPKGIWQRHFAPLLEDGILIDQQLYGIKLTQESWTLAVAALLNSAWFAFQLEMQGRVNFGEGVLWLAAYEIEALKLPSLHRLPADVMDQLAAGFKRLAQTPVVAIQEQLQLPAQRALDNIVFDLLAFTAAERESLVEALLERTASRQMTARPEIGQK